MSRKRSFLTVTDQFCGAGGSSLGAAAAGLEIRMAMNHWKLAVETHNTNFPDADHDCADISATDPRRYPSTDILITSPECTTHSPAGGNKHRKSTQRDLFVPTELDPATQRSRATMWDVVRFTEYHQYRAVIVENVVEVVRTWPLFWTWWKAMETLGYVGQLVSLNSMFAHPTPQSRDRIYIIWTRRGNKRPDLAIAPAAPCARCGEVEARQTWKTGRSVGKYGPRNQYVYTCPKCRAVVTPYFFCALNALDFSIPAVRIGDRPVPLRPRTLERVRYGLEKYGRRPLQVTVNNKSGVSCRVRGVEDPLFGQTTSNTTAVIAPWLVNAGSNAFRTRSAAEEVVPTMTGSERAAVAGFSPFLSVARENVRAKALDDPSPALVASANQIGIVQPSALFTPFTVTNRTNALGRALDQELPAVCTGYHHALVQPAALVRLLGDRPVKPLDAPVPAQTTGEAQNLLVSPSPFLVQYYGTGTATEIERPVPTVPTIQQHALVEPCSIDVDDCYFRMMTSREIGAAMAFPGTYTVLGTNGQQIKQYGNAVTPPAMALLIERVVQSITGERAA
jgi:DNA (cytosine-5)-methyltransferase 1